MPFQSLVYPDSSENPSKRCSPKRLHQPARLVFFWLAVICFARCAAAQSQLTLSTASLSFGNVAVGTMSTQVVTLENTGMPTIVVATVQGSSFSLSGLTSLATFAVDSTTTLYVTFAPTAIGSVTGHILIASSDLALLGISLSGTGVEPQPSATLSASSLAFGTQAVGTTSAAQSLTLSNSGNAALSIASIALTGTNPSAFAESNNCGSSVAAGAQCTISVIFTPSASGAFAASVTVTDNASGSTQTATLSGTGGSTGSPSVSVSPTSLSFGNEPDDVASSSQTVTLTNSGSAALTVSAVSLTGTNPTDFSENNTCSSVAAASSCTIVISFTPAASGSSSASLSIADNASGSPQTVALSGTGTSDVILTWTASTSSGVAGYYVYRGTTSGGESTTPLNSSPITGTTYTDESVQAGETYYYVVTAVSSIGTTQSADSNEASATVPST